MGFCYGGVWVFLAIRFLKALCAAMELSHLNSVRTNFNCINHKLIFHRHFLNYSKINLSSFSFPGKYGSHMSYCFLSVHKNDMKSGDGKESQHRVISRVPASSGWSRSCGLKVFGVVQLLRSTVFWSLNFS